jgi:hypothetical protein
LGAVSERGPVQDPEKAISSPYYWSFDHRFE